jgi:anti-sigma regulatory factor (Ser/Thr protein kinase)
MRRDHSSKEIIDFIIDNVDNYPTTINHITSQKFGVSRQSIQRYLSSLVSNNSLKAEGNTKSRRYILQPILEKQFVFSISPELKEDNYWRQNILPLLKDFKPNVLEICNYGFTEILNNAIEHSEGNSGWVAIIMYLNKAEMIIKDDGIGIFKKITRDLHLDDERHAVLELTKGKLTTDKTHHSGEGIFFTSRLFDLFSIVSGSLVFTHNQWNEDNWLLQDDKEMAGTCVKMEISTFSSRTLEEIFNKYASAKGDFSFSKTHVPVDLARYGSEQLISRSQGKRLLTRLEPFKEVFLDFKGVNFIGQAFADEIFRVYNNEHPETVIVWINTSPDVENMIKRVQTGLPGDDQLKLEI